MRCRCEKSRALRSNSTARLTWPDTQRRTTPKPIRSTTTADDGPDERSERTSVAVTEDVVDHPAGQVWQGDAARHEADGADGGDRHLAGVRQQEAEKAKEYSQGDSLVNDREAHQGAQGRAALLDAPLPAVAGAPHGVLRAQRQRGSRPRDDPGPGRRLPASAGARPRRPLRPRPPPHRHQPGRRAPRAAGGPGRRSPASASTASTCAATAGRTRAPGRSTWRRSSPSTTTTSPSPPRSRAAWPAAWPPTSTCPSSSTAPSRPIRAAPVRATSAAAGSRS